MQIRKKECLPLFPSNVGKSSVCCPALWVAQVLLQPMVVLNTLRFFQLRSPFLVMVCPSVKALPPATTCSFLPPTPLLQFFMFLLSFVFLYVLPFRCLIFLNLKFIFTSNSGALAETHRPTPPSLRHEPTSFPYRVRSKGGVHLWGAVRGPISRQEYTLSIS